MKELDLNSPIVTQNGVKFTLLAANGREPYPIVGYAGSNQNPGSYTREGFFNIDCADDARNLVNIEESIGEWRAFKRINGGIYLASLNWRSKEEAEDAVVAYGSWDGVAFFPK